MGSWRRVAAFLLPLSALLLLLAGCTSILGDFKQGPGSSDAGSGGDVTVPDSGTKEDTGADGAGPGDTSKDSEGLPESSTADSGALESGPSDTGAAGDSMMTSGGGDSAATYTVGGTVAGLAAGAMVVLQDNMGDDLTVSMDGSFTFATAIHGGSQYSVTVETQPANPSQTCTVTNGVGAIGADVTNVTVTCTTNTYSVGGTVSGLGPSDVVTLQDNDGSNLAVTGSGTFTFTDTVASGMPFAVTVLTQPPGLTCTVMGGTGTVTGANVTNVTVTCAANTYTIGGTLSGLPASTNVTLQDNLGDDLMLGANGSFMFATPLMSGAAYSVTVSVQPNGATCMVSSGTGTVSGAAVTSVVVNCAGGTYTFGGTVSSLAPGETLILENEGMASMDLFVSANGTYSFPPVAPGTMYSVAVKSNPASPSAQTCVLSNATGTMGMANVTNIDVSCTTNTYTIGGTLSGYAAGSPLVLQLNGANNLMVTAAGSFMFTPQPSGITYSVTILTQPSAPSQTCTVSNGSGTLGNTSVTSVMVSCVATPVGSYNVCDGPPEAAQWSNGPQSVSCVQACATIFGGSSNQWGCSTASGSLTHQAFLSEYAVAGCQTEADTYSKETTSYDCGSAGCSYSAYVCDNCFSTNYCWHL